VTTVLADNNMEGHAALLWTMLASEGWLDTTPLRLVTFADVGLSVHSSDRDVWRYAQGAGMLLLTNNRNMSDEDSLERAMRDESTSASLPVLTIGNLDRLRDADYRRRCAERLVEIVLDLGQYLGGHRIFIP
jgi:hypothetical protein